MTREAPLPEGAARPRLQWGERGSPDCRVRGHCGVMGCVAVRGLGFRLRSAMA